MSDYWGVGKAKRPMLPLLAIPTTAGTGSECQSSALIADEQTHQKMACLDSKVLARIALLDPELGIAIEVDEPGRVQRVGAAQRVAADVLRPAIVAGEQGPQARERFVDGAAGNVRHAPAKERFGVALRRDDAPAVREAPQAQRIASPVTAIAQQIGARVGVGRQRRDPRQLAGDLDLVERTRARAQRLEPALGLGPGGRRIAAVAAEEAVVDDVEIG